MFLRISRGKQDELTDKMPPLSWVCRFSRISVSGLLGGVSLFVPSPGCREALSYGRGWAVGRTHWAGGCLRAHFLCSLLCVLAFCTFFEAVISPPSFPHYFQLKLKVSGLWVGVRGPLRKHFLCEVSCLGLGLWSVKWYCTCLWMYPMKVGTACVKFQGKRDVRS